MARSLRRQADVDREQIGIAREFVANPEKYAGAQLIWARLFLARIEAESAERIEHDATGQGLLFGSIGAYPD
ncbi:MAG: hypothetical protein IPM24_03875 [Bryobacterales bacterium]|nr:hypothetical protein [Bryobacterales bacterium]